MSSIHIPDSRWCVARSSSIPSTVARPPPPHRVRQETSSRRGDTPGPGTISFETGRYLDR
jgi:hypothetical protein